MNPYQIYRLLAMRWQLRKRDTWSRQELERHRAVALRDLRTHAYAMSPFYRRFHDGLADRPLEELPVLTKAELMKNWDEVVTDRSVRLSEVQTFLANLRRFELFENRYVVNSTSGSTGLRGVFIYDPEEWLAVMASYTRANDWAGVAAGLARRLKLAVVSSTTPWHQSAAVGATFKSWFVPTLRIDSTEPMDQIVARLNDFQPRSLVAYANMARLLAQEQTVGKLRISPQAVFCAGEVLTGDAREIVRKAWGVEPFNVYGATETAGIASECTEHKGLHSYEDLVIAEVVDERNRPVGPGEYGAKLLVTVLFSRTLPLIRYEISDSVRLSVRRCACGRPFALMDDIQGRREEVIHLARRSGGVVPIQPNVFHNVMEPFPVGGWQIEQEERNLLKVLILDPGEGFSESDLISAMTRELARLGVDQPLVRVEYVTALNQTALGKTLLIKPLK